MDTTTLHAVFRRFAAALVLLVFAAAAAAGDKLFLWDVRGQANSVFLLGTVHFWKAEDYPLPAPIEEAFARARVLAVELDPTLPQARELILRRALYGPGDGLDRHLPAALLADAKRAAAGFGLDERFVLQAKPWLLSTVLVAAAAARSGYSAEAGMDARLVARARQDGKRIVELESAELQVALFESLSAAEQVLFVRQAVDLLRENGAAQLFDRFAAAWKRGDTEGLEALERLGLENEPLADSFLQRTVVDRNRAMAEKTAQLLESGEPALVAVGAAHLVGKDSVVELLRARGYSVRQVER